MQRAVIIFFLFIICNARAQNENAKSLKDYPHYHMLTAGATFATNLGSTYSGPSVYYMQRSFKPLSAIYGIGTGLLIPDIIKREEILFAEARLGLNVQVARVSYLRIALTPGVAYSAEDFEPLFGLEAGLGFNLWNIELGASGGVSNYYKEPMYTIKVHLGYIFSPNTRVMPK